VTRKLVFATRNQGKLVELRELLTGLDVISIDEVGRGGGQRQWIPSQLSGRQRRLRGLSGERIALHGSEGAVSHRRPDAI